MTDKLFYASIRQDLFGGKLTQAQVNGIDAILKEYVRLKLNDPRKLAYIFATAYHETSKTMQPIREYGKGAGMDYGKKLDIGKGKGKRVPYASPDHLYYGRGHVQLTWLSNYKNMGRLIGVDLVNNPDLMLTMEVSVKVLFEGMLRGVSKYGDFTGVALEDCFNDKIDDPIKARKIINGEDCKVLIAGYYRLFLKAIKL